jgi:hypothetical protein
MIIQKNNSIDTKETSNSSSRNTKNHPPTVTLIGKNGSSKLIN